LADGARPAPTVLTPGGAARGSDRAVPAVLVREDLTRAGAEPSTYDPTLLAAAARGEVELLTDADEVTAGTLLVLDPAVLGPPALPLPRLEAAQVVVAAVPPSATEPVRDLEMAGAAARALGGSGPVWVARTPAEQAAWAGDGWSVPLLEDVLAGYGLAGGPPPRLVAALDLVAELERAEEVLPRSAGDRLLLAGGRVVRTSHLDPRVEAMVPRPLRGTWSADDPSVRPVRVPVAADVVVLGKLDLAAGTKLRAAYPAAGLVLAAQPAGPRGDHGITRSVRAHEVVDRHVPGLAPRLVAHGRTASGTRYLVEELVEGKPLGGAGALDARAAELLAALARLHAGHGTTRVSVRERWGSGVADRWDGTVATGVVPERIVREVAGLLGREDTLRISWAHGDLVASNVLARPGGLTLLDWEHSQEAPVMHDAATLHLFCGDPAAVLDLVGAALGTPAGEGTYSGAEELALVHVQLLGRYPGRRERLRGHPRAEVYEQQVRRQVERLEQVLQRCDGSW
ncbi:MAG TPA: hypothetical protein VLO09_06875, partial [Ornithinimicrobium sp.]|nr:hypothetical protein [Ornithinimicrobium sp.]